MVSHQRETFEGSPVTPDGRVLAYAPAPSSPSSTPGSYPQATPSPSTPAPQATPPPSTTAHQATPPPSTTASSGPYGPSPTTRSPPAPSPSSSTPQGTQTTGMNQQQSTPAPQPTYKPGTGTSYTYSNNTASSNGANGNKPYVSGNGTGNAYTYNNYGDNSTYGSNNPKPTPTTPVPTTPKPTTPTPTTPKAPSSTTPKPPTPSTSSANNPVSTPATSSPTSATSRDSTPVSAPNPPQTGSSPVANSVAADTSAPSSGNNAMAPSTVGPADVATTANTPTSGDTASTTSPLPPSAGSSISTTSSSPSESNTPVVGSPSGSSEPAVTGPTSASTPTPTTTEAPQTLAPPVTTPAPGSSSTNNGANSLSHGITTNTIVLGVVIAVACIGVIAGIIFYLIHRRRERQLLARTPVSDDRLGSFREIRGDPRDLPSDFRNDPVLKNARIPLGEIHIHPGDPLSHGNFGEVRLATYRDQTVVVKRLHKDRRLDWKETQAFASEIKLMAMLSHPRIVQLVGAAWDSPAMLCAVTEYMDGRDLLALINSFNTTGRRVGYDYQKIKIALHIVQALEYLHERRFIHRDLKSKNVVLSAAGEAKLTDFGISRDRCEHTKTVGVGSMLWMAPEVFSGGNYDEKADIFSYGVVLSELDTQMLPYRYGREGNDQLNDVARYEKVMDGSLTVAFTGQDPMTQLAQKCVAVNPRDRPSAAELRVGIQAILRH